jgi:hypothetical protein
MVAEQQGGGAGEQQQQLALLLQRTLGHWRRNEKIETWSDRSRIHGWAEEGQRIEIKGEARRKEEGEVVAIGVRAERNEWWQGMSGVRGFQQDSCLIHNLFVSNCMIILAPAST